MQTLKVLPMHNSTNLLPGSRRIKRCLLLLGLLLGLGCQQAFALIENNLACTPTGTTGVVNLGDLAPGQYFETRMTGSCRVTRNFPYGSSLQHTQVWTGTIDTGWPIYAWSDAGGVVPEQPWGVASTTCMSPNGNVCQRLPVGTIVPYSVLYYMPYGVKNPGNYSITFNLTSTSIKGYEGYVDKIQTLTLKFRIINPACTMSSNSALNLPFGTLNSNDFATSQQLANVTLNCTRGTQATATLVPTQSAVSGSPGVSATTLAGLSMAATWADNNSAVTFNSPRTLNLTTGANTIRLGFRPRLNTSVSPTGSFTSQYTLNINYL